MFQDPSGTDVTCAAYEFSGSSCIIYSDVDSQALQANDASKIYIKQCVDSK